MFDATIPYDLRFFQALDHIVQTEPWLERDKAMIDHLKSIGIEKGKPFNPDPKTQAILNDAAREARARIDATYERLYTQSYYEGGHQTLPASSEVVERQATVYANPDVYPADGRGLTYAFAFIGIKRLGGGQYYLFAIKDKEGRPLDRADTYRLTVLANAPVKQYWSGTAYDRATHAFIRDMARLSRSSQNAEVQKNADGSVDLRFGRKAPTGKETNWIPTSPAGNLKSSSASTVLRNHCSTRRG